MADEELTPLRELDRTFRVSRAAAERCLPHLLGLSGHALVEELARRTDLQPGLTHLLLTLANDAVDRDSVRVHELTTAVVTCVGPHVSHLHETVANWLRGQAFIAHADALRALGRYGEARAAIATAHGFIRGGMGSSWSLAMTDVIEARILHEEGARVEALRRIRQAARGFLLHGGVERYVIVRMIEAWMQWTNGDRAAAADVWRDAGEEAMARGDAVCAALLKNRTGMFLLRHGMAAEAARYFEHARATFEAAGRHREALRARWGMAEAAAARGDYDRAILEFHEVQARMVAAGDLTEAAVAAAEILELLLVAGRDDEALPLAGSIVARFTDAGLTLNALRAWTFIRQCARARALTAEDVTAVRVYFEQLPLRPNARFEVPGGRP